MTTPFVIVPILLFFILNNEAYAYVDPGSGQLLWQLLLGIILGGAFQFRKIVGFLKRKLNKKKPNES